VDVLDLENYSASDCLAREKLVVLCIATYGDGEPTDNAADFFSWLSTEVEAVTSGAKEPFLQVCAMRAVLITIFLKALTILKVGQNHTYTGICVGLAKIIRTFGVPSKKVIYDI
jgi:hypothetical protein